MTHTPLIVAVGGTTRAMSSTEKALRLVLREVESNGARTMIFCGDDLNIPIYAPGEPSQSAKVASLVEALSRADGIILGSPGYHGSISGLMKNVLDYAEYLRADTRPYFSGRAIGCLAIGGGWAGAIHTLGALRDIVHALRGWPTPLGVAINSSEEPFDDEGEARSPRLNRDLQIMANEVMTFANAGVCGIS